VEQEREADHPLTPVPGLLSHWRGRATPGQRALEELVMPALLVRRSALESNVAVMAAYCREQGVKLAPHAKTHMAPKLLEMQRAAGAWGFTAATPWQLRLLREWGFERVIYANQIVEPLVVEWLRAQEGFEVWCLVDSVEAVDAVRGLDVRLLVELGHPGGRTGCRTNEEAERVAAAAGDRLRGVECFEGTIPGELGEIDRLLDRCNAMLDRLGLSFVSAGGSAYFDRVVECFRGREVVLRSGCYVTQDGGFYKRMSPLREQLETALELWGAVLSVPEAGVAVASFGKRDTGFDLGYPVPFARHRRGEGTQPLTGKVVALSDQHAHVRVEGDVKVGDLLGAHPVHPCTTFDKWRRPLLVDDDRTVVDALPTYF
jgi:D-serine deaminase-like pyridoxal phosphate-dependent protein